MPATEWSWLAAAHAGRDGIPVALVNSVPDSDADADTFDGYRKRRVERWRLDKLTRTSPALPDALRAVFDDAGATWMVLSEPDGSLRVRPLPPAQEDPSRKGCGNRCPSASFRPPTYRR